MEEEVVEVATKVAFSFKPMVLAATAVVSLAAGVNIGFFVANRRLKTKYEELAAAEIAEAKEHYKRLNKREEYSSPEQAAKALLTIGDKVVVTEAMLTVPAEVKEVFKEYGNPDPRPPLTDKNIFTTPQPPEESLVETSGRFVSPINSNGPYVITEYEYNDGEVGYNQINLTYFAGDDILADENEAPILEVEQTIGDALKRFGEGCEDKDTVFVRNTRIQLDFEVTRSTGKYSVEVAGLPDDSLQHSDEPMRRRTRLRDE